MTPSGLPDAWWGLVKPVATSWLEDYVPSMGAAPAYYAMFSLAQPLLIVVSVAGRQRYQLLFQRSTSTLAAPYVACAFIRDV